ncbi:VOC family protein [Flagellimonas algicola]|uniref:VOC family protein n=1 Tax=Flagellimonas algicola TaxID=2583815 RepID=A0ABY2WPP1_9FLAO|nr:VOC family protein [Allomuricauda algicola]TMU56955.1 VOC family protein [Allomuricauda algicola]
MKLSFFLGLLSFIYLNPTMAQTEFDKPYISIGVAVTDLETSLDFYTNIIGMKELGEFSVTDEMAKKTGLTGGKAFDVTVLKLYDDPNATEYKLMSFGNEKNEEEKHIQDRNGMRYITIFYKSLDAVTQRLEDHNIAILSQKPTLIPDGRKFILVQDPDGTFIELIGN